MGVSFVKRRSVLDLCSVSSPDRIVLRWIAEPHPTYNPAMAQALVVFELLAKWEWAREHLHVHRASVAMVQLDGACCRLLPGGQ